MLSFLAMRQYRSLARNYIYTVMARQGKLMDVVRRSQEATNDRNLMKRYANYQRLPQLRTSTKRGSASEEHKHPKDDPSPSGWAIAHAVDNMRQEVR